MRRIIASALCAWIVGGCGGGGSVARTEEVWVVDFQTWAADIDDVLGPRGLDRDAVAGHALACMREHFAGLAIRFRLGTEPRDGESYVCVRKGDGGILGRGILDPGNEGVESSCGLNHGLLLGVFVENVVGLIETQGADANQERVGRLLGVVLSHEIGHGLGLTHSIGVTGPGDIMTGAGIVDVRHEDFHFVPEHRAILARNLDFTPAEPEPDLPRPPAPAPRVGP